MAGIYIHIPFCKKACNYCDFHFSTSFTYKEQVIEAIRKEIKERKNYLDSPRIETIYFGGGTPSVLNQEELQSILETIYTEMEVTPNAEITLEANPDDLTLEKLTQLKEIGINRLSIGIQSFIERDLVFMNRSHTIEQTLSAIQNAKKVGFDNLTIDLIYGIPNLTISEWKENIAKAVALEVNHISAYCLTSEERTAMHHDIKKGKYQLPKEEVTSSQFEILIEELHNNGFEQYEISNFSKIGHHSKHNSSYWKQKHYLGVGPSAHSYNEKTRVWNVANNARYLKAVKENKWDFEEEILDSKTRYNEYVMTSLRTKWGVNLEYLQANFSENFLSHFLSESKTFVEENHLLKSKNKITLTASGKLLADYIASELFWVE